MLIFKYYNRCTTFKFSFSTPIACLYLSRVFHLFISLIMTRIQINFVMPHYILMEVFNKGWWHRSGYNRLSKPRDCYSRSIPSLTIRFTLILLNIYVLCQWFLSGTLWSIYTHYAWETWHSIRPSHLYTNTDYFC